MDGKIEVTRIGKNNHYTVKYFDSYTDAQIFVKDQSRIKRNHNFVFVIEVGSNTYDFYQNGEYVCSDISFFHFYRLLKF